jgi:predicted solute-binding protein
MSTPAQRHGGDIEVALEDAEASAAEAIAREVGATPASVDSHLRKAIEEAVDHAVAAAMDGVRKAHQANLERLDAHIQKAVEQALGKVNGTRKGKPKKKK